MKRLRHFFYPLVFLLALAAGGMSVLYHGLGEGPRQIWQAQGWRSLVDGSLTHSIDAGVAASLPSNAVLNGWIDGALYKFLGDAGPQVRAGCREWLFLSEELLEVPNGNRHLAVRAQLANKIKTDLAARGVTLIMLPVPDKATQAHTATCGLAVSGQARRRSADWQAATAGAALVQVDLAAGWPTPGYWRTDTHWDRSGARFAAQRTAAALQAIAGPDVQNVQLETAAAALPRTGDLIRLANLEYAMARFGPAPESELDQTAVIARSGGLLDDAPAPSVILAGSSYSLNSGFIDYLQYASKRDIAQMSLKGGGFAGALLDLLEKHPDLLKQTRIVVWEWPMRSLTLPLTEAENRYLGKKAND